MTRRRRTLDLGGQVIAALALAALVSAYLLFIALILVALGALLHVGWKLV